MWFRIVLTAGLLGLSGCASIPDDWGRSKVEKQVTAHGRPAPEGRAAERLDALMSEPLEPESAVEVALINNPAVRAEYARLGLSAADVYEAGRLSNPTLSWSRLDPDEPGLVDQVTFGLATSFTDLLLLPARSSLAEAEFARVQLQTANAILILAADVEAAWYRLAGLTLAARMAETIAKAAGTTAELSQRYFDAGNINQLQLALSQAAAAEAQLDALTAEQARQAAHSKLSNLLGLGSGGSWQIEAALPLPLASEQELADLLELARENRLDLAAARKAVSIYAKHQRITENWRWLGDVEIGVETERETDGTRLTGPTLALELPIFNTHADDIARTEARLLGARAELDALVKAIENQVRLARQNVENARLKVLLFRERLMPLRAEIVKRTQLHYNYMLTGVFELLRVKQQQFDAFGDYLTALTDYWLARVALSRAVGTQLPGANRPDEASIDAQSLLQLDDSMPAMQHPSRKSTDDKSAHHHHDGGSS